jgi:8-amino-7-oxononanoate synthase
MKGKLEQFKKNNLFRKFRTIGSASTSTVQYNGKQYIMLASNNYFGLNTHPSVTKAAKEAISNYGTSNGSSRLIANLKIQEDLEKEIASYKKCQSSLVYSSGYAANVGIISSIMNENDLILSDELNHASIIDGCRLSKSKTSIYKHCDVGDLSKKLKSSNKKRKQKSKTLVVTDTIFSMDGDSAPLKEIIELKKKYGFLLMTDDAHSTGIIDTNHKEIGIKMGTLSKALASQGGYAAGSKELIDYLRNFSRTFFFSSGLSPANCAAALSALKIIQKGKSLKKRLLANADYMRSGLLKMGFDARGNYQIIPVMTKDNNTTMKFQKLLEQNKIFVTGIRQPTVKEPRLRVSVMSTHTKTQLDLTLDAFEKSGKKLKLI